MFRKGRGTKNQVANNHLIIGKAKEFQENTTASLSTPKAFDYVDQNTLWKIKEMGLPGYLSAEKPI